MKNLVQEGVPVKARVKYFALTQIISSYVNDLLYLIWEVVVDKENLLVQEDVPVRSLVVLIVPKIQPLVICHLFLVRQDQQVLYQQNFIQQLLEPCLRLI